MNTFVAMPINFFKHLADQSAGHMLRIAAPDNLQEAVEGFYVFKGSYSQQKELFFNDGYPTLVLMKNENEVVEINVEGQTTAVGSSWVCGGFLRNIYGGSNLQFQDCLVIRFHAVAFFKLFGIEEDCFKNKQIFDFVDIAGNGYEAFTRDFYQCVTLEEKLAIVNSALSEKMGSYSYPKILSDIQRRMDGENNLSVKDILNSYETRLNYKWLERNFKKHVGLSPQNYLLIRRFLKAYLDLEALQTKDLLQVALDNGYYDDNHFIKDFRRFCGTAPKTYFRGPVKLPASA